MVSRKKAVHGGDFFKAIGESLLDLSRAKDVISADVLDAWYDPAPEVLSTIHENLEFLVRTSPPTHGEGLRESIAAARGVKPERVLIGAGTSSLMFLAFPKLLNSESRVLVFDPSYGEYAHLVHEVIGGELVRFELPLSDFDPDLDALDRAILGVDMVVIVNPNSPTGRLVEREVLGDLIRRHPEQTFWVDETYIDFATIATGRNQSLEDLNLPNLVVCKSLSKFYGLSGLRVGYLVADENRVSDWDVFSPPWSVGLIGQVAGVLALQSDPYYRARAIETHEYARDLEEALVELEFRVVPTSTNFVFAQRSGVKELCARLAERGVFVRDASSLSPRFADEWLRIAVKAPEQQDRLIAELRSILG